MGRAEAPIISFTARSYSASHWTVLDYKLHTLHIYQVQRRRRRRTSTRQTDWTIIQDTAIRRRDGRNIPDTTGETWEVEEIEIDFINNAEIKNHGCLFYRMRKGVG